MKLKILLVFNAIVALAFGIGCVLIPATVSELYGMTPSPATNLGTQFFGQALIGVGLICWLVRNVSNLDSQRAIVLSQLISTTIGVIVAVMGTTSGVLNSLGWLAVAIYVLLAFGYGYLQFAKVSSS